MAVTELAKRCKAALERYYRSQLKGLVTYGSATRNQADPSSDVDLLALLGQPFDYFHELRRIVELLYPMQLESDWLISARRAGWDEFEAGGVQLYRIAKRERALV